MTQIKLPSSDKSCIFSCRTSFIIILTFFITINAVEETEELQKECGQYGFNCVDEKTLEFCPIVVDGATDLAQLYECDENFTCDEDNPSYCTPKEPPNKLLQDTNKNGHLVNGEIGFVDLAKDVHDEVYYGDNDWYYRQARAAVASHEDPCVCETTTLPTETTIRTTETNEESDFTTVNYTPASPFDCDSYGFFADQKNSSLFWHCDVPINGLGFLLRHMKCGRDRFFDETLKSCVLEGSIRQLRKYDSKNDVENGKRKIKYTTDCKNRKPGKYADEFDCHIYHICLSKQFSPAVQMTFMCPRQTAYDCISRSCTIAAFKRCEVKKQKETNNINCTTPMRFRSIDDCRKYFVCFVDNVIEIKCPKFYKFDDDSMECLPEKVANCKENPV
ncbi:uncharacterized protein LOC129911342 [Episyrphus balteatus]|uniref:uncharacterized protein LOC129911342 n=1 Tax=Episyrphus balteatus TaxID=286459 RepID=UPI002484DE5E|nr:uncharacterized protein LOC129911342 [Episyrphus balteatus]